MLKHQDKKILQLVLAHLPRVSHSARLGENACVLEVPSVVLLSLLISIFI